MIKVLSVHFTANCTRQCSFCYIQRHAPERPPRDHTFFLGLPTVASQVGIPQIALGGGEPSLYPEFVDHFARECARHSIAVTLTTNGDNVTRSTADHFRKLDMVSFSIDSEKVRGIHALAQLVGKMTILRDLGIKVGANILLDRQTYANLMTFVEFVARHTDALFFLQKKPSDLPDLLRVKRDLLMLTALFPNVHVDDSLQLAFGHKVCCGHGREIISINPWGDAHFCSFDAPFATLTNPGDLIRLLKDYYPQVATVKCPFI